MDLEVVGKELNSSEEGLLAVDADRLFLHKIMESFLELGPSREKFLRSLEESVVVRNLLVGEGVGELALGKFDLHKRVYSIINWQLVVSQLFNSDQRSIFLYFCTNSSAFSSLRRLRIARRYLASSRLFFKVASL